MEKISYSEVLEILNRVNEVVIYASRTGYANEWYEVNKAEDLDNVRYLWIGGRGLTDGQYFRLK